MAVRDAAWKELRAARRLRRAIEEQVIERFIEREDPHRGFARIYCDSCGHNYSNRARGERATPLKGHHMPATTAAAVEAVSAFTACAKAAWARLIRKVYGANPLECPKCQRPMHLIALIDDPAVVRRILEHLECWAPDPAARGPTA